MIYDSGAYHDVMEKALALATGRDLPSARPQAEKQGKLRGIGVANYVDTATGIPRERAELTVHPDGSVDVVIGTVSNGQGHETSFAQLLNEWLGVPIDKVRLITGDTDIVKVGGGTHSGRGMRLGEHRDLEGRRPDHRERQARRGAADAGASPRRSSSMTGSSPRKPSGGAMTLAEVAAAMAERADLPAELRGRIDRRHATRP